MSRPQHHKAVRLRLASAALGLGAVIALTGCSAGQMTETDTQVAAIDGGNGEVNGLAIRDATLTFPPKDSAYPAGSSAPLRLVLSNETSTNDRLVQVTSPYAASAQLGGKTDLPGRTSLHALGEPASGSQQSTGQQPGGQQSTGQQPGQQPSGQNQPAPGGAAGQPEVEITLNGLTQEIRPGVTVPVTFVFEKAGPVTVQVPIGADPSPRPEGEGH